MAAERPPEDSSPDSTVPRLLARPGTNLLIKVPGFSNYLPSRLVGGQPGQCLVATCPGALFTVGGLGPEIELTVSFLEGGRIFGFRSPVLGRYHNGGLRFIFLEYPRQVETMDIRRYPRIACSLPARLWADGQELPAVVIDLSLGGAGVVSKTGEGFPPELGVEAAVWLRCRLPGERKPQELAGVVRSLVCQDGWLRVGMEFTSPEGEGPAAVRGYLERVGQYVQAAGSLPFSL